MRPIEPGLTVKQACEILGCSPPTIYKLLSTGGLDGYKVGSSRRITPASIRSITGQPVASPEPVGDTPREILVARQHESGMTFAEIGEALGLTRTRARQLAIKGHFLDPKIVDIDAESFGYLQEESIPRTVFPHSSLPTAMVGQSIVLRYSHLQVLIGAKITHVATDWIYCKADPIHRRDRTTTS